LSDAIGMTDRGFNPKWTDLILKIYRTILGQKLFFLKLPELYTETVAPCCEMKLC